MKEYATDLRRTDAQLVSLVPRIAGDMDILLSKLADTRIQRVAPSQDAGQEDSRNVHAVPAGSQTPRLFSRQTRDLHRHSSQAVSGGGHSAVADHQSHCSHCQHLAQELQLPLSYNHSPLACRRRRVQVRRIEDDYTQAVTVTQEFTEDSQDDGVTMEDFYGDVEDCVHTGQSAAPVSYDTWNNVQQLQAKEPVQDEGVQPLSLIHI